MAGDNQVGSTVGGLAGGLAGGALLGMLDGPLPILDSIGGIVGGKIGETIGSYMPKMRMAGDIFKKGLVDPIKIPPFTNPLVPPTQLDQYAIYN